MEGKNEKSMSKVAAPGSLRPLALKSEILSEFEFVKNYKDLYGKSCWWARLAHQQHFPYKSFKFSKTSNCHKNSLCNVRRLKLGHLHIFDMFFSFLASVLYHDRFWRLTRSRDRVMQRAYWSQILLHAFLLVIFQYSFVCYIHLIRKQKPKVEVNLKALESCENLIYPMWAIVLAKYAIPQIYQDFNPDCLIQSPAHTIY